MQSLCFVKIFTLSFLLCWVGAKAWGQVGNPFIENFNARKDYDGHTQNWTTLQDSSGLLYVGNSDGLLIYDGVSFKRVESQGVLRSLATDKNNILYAGFKGEFGYFIPDERGELKYKSLSNQIVTIDEKAKDFGNVWKVFVIGDAVYFCAFEAIFKYQNLRLQKIIKPQKRFFVAFLIENQIYLSEPNRGILKIENDTIRVLKNSAFLGNSNVYNIFKHKEKIAIGTRQKGFFTFDKQTETFNPFPMEIDSSLAKKRFIPIRKSPQNELIIGTAEGIIVADENGHLKNSIDNTTGLNDNTAWDIQLDRQQNIWASLNNGLARINLNTPLTYWNSKSGIVGNKVYCIARFQGTIYVGTSDGVFYIADKIAKKVADSENQCWAFLHLFPKTSQEKLLYVSNGGIHEIKHKKAIDLYGLSSNYTALQPFKDKNLFYVGNRDSIYIFEYAQPKLILKDKVKGLKGEFRYLTTDQKGNVAAEIANKGIVYLKNISPETLQPTSFTMLGDKLIDTKSIDIGMVIRKEQFLVFCRNKTFGLTKDSILLPIKLNYPIKEDDFQILRTATDQQNNLWVSGQKTDNQYSELLLGYFDEKDIFHYKELLQMPNTEVNVIYPDSLGIVWFGTSDGLFRYDSKITKNYSFAFQTHIRQVEINGDSTIFGGHYYQKLTNQPQDSLRFQVLFEQPTSFIPNLGYAFNDITFSFAATFFENHQQNEYSYYLQGFDENWSVWTKETKKEYTNLPAGTYKFRVKSKNIYGTEGKEANYQFKILPPWYQTWWAYLGYVLLAILTIYTTVRLYTRNLQARNAALEQTIAERTAQIEAKKQEIENSYENIQVLSEIGKQITASLDLDKVLNTLYENVNQLMDATVFGIGLYDEAKQQIHYRLAIENGVRYTPFSRTMADKNQFPVWCIEQKNDVMIADVFVEYQRYIATYQDEEQKTSLEDGSLTNTVYAMLYTPIFANDKIVGVITVQSYQRNTYTVYHLNILKSLAIYASIALKNADTFHEIELQKQEILASINYAKRIQNAMLPTTQDLDKLLGVANYFVLYKPRDIVSGDFYWCKEVNGKVIFAVADCTGHGVPGAFVSMVGNAALNEITKRGLSHTHLILNKLDKEITNFFNQNTQIINAEDSQTKDNLQVQDGMDICLIAIDKEQKKINYSGAMNPLYFVQEGNILELKADKKAIGGNKTMQNTFDFASKEIDFTSKTTVYLCSDGYQDQFGGAANKKFMTKKLRELLLSVSHLPMTEQRQILNKTIVEWVGTGEQTDDIALVGLVLKP